MLEADGLRDAIVGTCYDNATQRFRLVYDLKKCIKILVNREGISQEAAADWLTYNTVTGLGGQDQPIFLENYKI